MPGLPVEVVAGGLAVGLGALSAVVFRRTPRRRGHGYGLLVEADRRDDLAAARRSCARLTAAGLRATVATADEPVRVSADGYARRPPFIVLVFPHDLDRAAAVLAGPPE